MNCTSCGMENDGEDNFCGYCSASLTQLSGKSEKRHIWLLVASAFGFFFLGIFRIAGTLLGGVAGSLNESQARDNVADLEVKFHTNPSRQVAKDLAKAKERLASIRAERSR